MSLAPQLGHVSNFCGAKHRPLEPFQSASGQSTLAEQLLWGGACGGDAEIVRMALEQIDRPRDEPRWFHIMEQPIRMWSDGGAQLDCLKLILERCDPNILGRSTIQSSDH